jgi:hypothetical protein
MRLNGIERRADTVSYTCFEEDRWFAVAAAEKIGVTMEEIVRNDGEEDYEMVVQGEHKGWKAMSVAIAGGKYVKTEKA